MRFSAWSASCRELGWMAGGTSGPLPGRGRATRSAGGSPRRGAGLEGGRIIRADAWARTGDPVGGGLAAARTGRVTGAALAAAGVVALALGYIGGLGLGLIGFLMIAAAGAEARQVLLTAAL